MVSEFAVSREVLIVSSAEGRDGFSYRWKLVCYIMWSIVKEIEDELSLKWICSVRIGDEFSIGRTCYRKGVKKVDWFSPDNVTIFTMVHFQNDLTKERAQSLYYHTIITQQ